MVLSNMNKTKDIYKTAFSMQEASISLGVSYPTIKRWRAEGKFSCVKIGRVVLIPRKEIERLLQENMEQ